MRAPTSALAGICFSIILGLSAVIVSTEVRAEQAPLVPPKVPPKQYPATPKYLCLAKETAACPGGAQDHWQVQCVRTKPGTTLAEVKSGNFCCLQWRCVPKG